MADLHKEMGDFHDRIALTAPSKESLRTSRNAVRERVRKYFRDTLKLAAPKFFMQGSFAMGTTVVPIDGEFDVDDGVYLQHLDGASKKDWPSPETVHRWLVSATEGQTKERPTDKRTCVRITYAGSYHVDLPCYGILNGNFLLGEKGAAGWHPSDSRALTEWFLGHIKTHKEQLRRLVRVLKAWADFQSGRRGKMPSGLVLTVLAARHFRADARDDKALVDTAAAIKSAVHPFFFLLNPVDVSEELTARLSEVQKSRFQEAIGELASKADDAANAPDRETASRLWRSQFGDRFPLVRQDSPTKASYSTVSGVAALFTARKPPKPWAVQ